MKNNIFRTLLTLSFLPLIVACGANTPSSEITSSPESSGGEVSTQEEPSISDDEKKIPTNLNPDFEYSDLVGINHKDDVDFTRYRFNNYEDYCLSNYRHLYDTYPFVGDPHIYYEDGTFYIVGTNDQQCARAVMYKTADFATYERVTGFDVDFNDPDLWSYGVHAIFAPELYQFNGKYYFYYSDQSRITGKRSISVMVADDIEGEFHEYDITRPAFDHTSCPIYNVSAFSILDQTVFQDDDGELYMYFSSYINAGTKVGQWIYGVKLKSPTEADWSTCKLVCKPGFRTTDSLLEEMLWETWPPLNSGGFAVTEGPSMMKVNGKYYLTYSCNHNTQTYYTPCYAVSDSPLGDFVKPYAKNKLWTNLLFGCAGHDGRYSPENVPTYQMWNGYMSGCGHHAVVKIEGEYYICYHNFVNYSNNKNGRCFGLDKLYFDTDGNFVVGAPTRAVQPNFELISGKHNLALDAEIIVDGEINNKQYLNDNRVTNFPFTEKSKILTESQLNYETEFSSGTSYIKIVLDKPHAISSLFIYNTLDYEKAYLDPIKFINFGNGNVVRQLEFDENYVDDEKQFIYPCSAFMVDIESEVVTDTIIIALEADSAFKLSEIMVLGD